MMFKRKAKLSDKIGYFGIDHYGTFDTYVSKEWIDKIKRVRINDRLFLNANGIYKAIEDISNLDLNDYGDNLYQFQNKVIEILKKLGE